MVLKIQVEFSTPISIQGENAKNSMFVILEPYLDNETSSDVPDFAGGALGAADNGFVATTTHLGQTFTNVFETNPTNVVVNGNKLKLSLDSYFDDIYQYLKTFHFFYEEQQENGKIVRGDVAASLSQSTKIAVSNSTGLVEQTQQGGDLEPKQQFGFKIEKILIKDEEPDKIFYFYTSNRTLKIENNSDGQAINPVNGTFAVNVGNFLTQTFTNDDEYFNTANGQATAFATDNDAGVTIGQNAEGKFFSVQRDTTQGRLTKNSVFSSASIEPGTYNTTDEFGFPLEIDLNNHTEVENKIKNPTLHAEIIPSIGGEGYIAVKMSKNGSNGPFLNMVGVTKDEDNNITNNDSDRTIRHGGTDNDDVATHPVTGGLVVSSDNAFNDTALNFNFKATGTQEIANIVTGDELKIDENNPDVILMRLNRFPRHGITYSINYGHQLNLASGIFGPNNHGVLTQNPIPVTNDLKEVTARVGKLKVYYPPSKPVTFSNRPSGATGDFDAYYYVDITFQRGGQDVDITAKYDINKPTDANAFDYQADSGHKIHHGLIISKDNSDVNTVIFEDITRTTIRDQNGDPVTLGENSFGKFLRIEVPFAVGNPVSGTEGAYPYNTSNGLLTSKNFADLDSTSPPGILLSDREEKDVGAVGTGSYYYINVMDSQGNVVKPFNIALQTDTDWKKDTGGNTPSVESIEYKVEWDSTAGVWVKELVLTHHQDLQGAGVVGSLVLKDDTDALNLLSSVALDSDEKILIVSINDPYNTISSTEITVGNITLEYTKPGTANNLTNWLGFEIEEYTVGNAKTVTLDASNPALLSFSSVNLGAITDGTGSFSVPLQWTQSGNDNGITYYPEYSVDGGSSYTALPDSGITLSPTSGTRVSVLVSGLSYDQAYTFRVRASTYDYGPYSSSVSLSAQTTPDTSPPDTTSSTFSWSYQEIGSTTWTQINQAETLGVGYKLRVQISSVTDSTGCSVLSNSVSVDTGSGSGTITTPTVTGNTTDGFTVEMIYTVGGGDTGAISFAMTLTDGTNSDSINPSPADSNGNAITVTADTTAPTYSSSTAVPSAGTSFSITFSEDISVDTANGGSVTSVDFTLTVDGSTVTGFSVAINSTSDGIDFTNIPTIYSGESVSVSYVQSNTEANRLRDEAGNLLAGFTQSITNSSTQTSGGGGGGGPGDTSGPSLSSSTFTWQYQESGTSNWLPSSGSLSQSKSLGVGDKLRLQISSVTDATGCSVSAESVSVGNGSTNGTITTPTVTGNTANGFSVEMIYTVGGSDTGAISFAMTLTDGINTPTSLTSSQGTPPLGVTADTTAPAISGTPTWEVRDSNGAKTGNMSHIALPSEKIRLNFNTTTTDLDSITVTGIEFNDNGDGANNNEEYQVSNVTTNVNSGSVTGHYIEYEVHGSSNDMGFPKFIFKLEDTNGNESSEETEQQQQEILASSVQARQYQQPSDNNTEFQVKLIEVNNLTQDYGEVQFDLSYNVTSDFYLPYDINKIVFNADKDISYNNLESPPWNKWFIDTGVNNNYTMTDDGGQYNPSVNNLFDSNGDYSIKSSAFNNAHPKKHEGSIGAIDYPGIGGGDKFIEVKLHFNYENGNSGVYRRIFEQKDSNGNLTGTAFTMQDGSTTKAYTSVRSAGAAQGVNRYNNNYVNNNDNWVDKEDDPYLMALHNFSQKTNANNEPIKSFKLNADYSTVSAKYKFPTYLWGSVLKGKIEDLNGWTQCGAWNGAGNWPIRRYDISKNILEYDIKGYYIKAEENNDETVLTYDNGQTDNNKYLIDVNDITAYSQTAKLYNDDPFIQQNGATQRKYPEMINYIHRFKMDEMNGTSDNLVKYGISGEKIDWQITPVNEHDFGKINLAADGTGSLSWNSASEYAAHGDNVKQGYIPRLPFNDTNLQDPEFINKSGGTNKSTTADQFESTYDSSGNFDVSFNYWEEGKQLYFPSNNYDYSYNSVGSTPESKSYFVNKFKFHTDISGATPAFASSINLEMKVMNLDNGISTTSQALYVQGDTFTMSTTQATNGFASSSVGVQSNYQYPNKLEVYEGITYIFDVSHHTNSLYEINFSTTTPTAADTAYTSIGSSSITRNGDPGTSGATVTIVAPSSTMYIYDSSNNGLNKPEDGFGGPLMDQKFEFGGGGEEGEESGGYSWTLNTVTTNGTLGVASVEPDGDYRIKDISWNETYNGIMGNGDTNDISFNVTDLSNNRYYKYYYTITNTLCKTDASGVRFPQEEYNSILTNPANPTAIFNNFENYTDNTETDVAVNAPNAYPAIPLGFFAGGGFGVVAGAPIGVGYGTDVENMLFNVEWKYKERSYEASSLQREPLGLSSDVQLQNRHDAEAFGYSISMSGDGKTIAVGAPYYDERVNDNTGNFQASTTKKGRVVVYKWRNSRWEIDEFNTGSDNTNDSSFGSAEFNHGYSLSLNHNGNVLIVGAPGEHVGSVAKGRARVYLYNEIRNVWDETFNSLLTNIPNVPPDDRYFPFDDYFNNQSVNKYTECGGSVAVSANGKTIIAGGRTFQTTGIPESGGTTVSIRTGHIQVAFWSDEHQRYQDKIIIYFDGQTDSNPSVGALSTTSGTPSFYPYEGQDIRAYGPITSTGERSVEFGYSVAASGDGKLFSTGSPFWSGDRNYSNTSAIAFTADGNGDKTGKVALFYRAASSSLPTSSLKTNAHNGLGTSSNVNVLQGNAFADLSEDSNGRYELNKAGFNNSITDMSDNEFGYALSFNNGNRLAVSAPGEDHSNYDYKGSVYIYDCSGTATGVLGSEKVNLICKIKNHNTSNDDEYFGAGLSLSGNGNYVAIGQPFKNIGSKTDCGIVQVFKIPEPETITYTVRVDPASSGSGNNYYIDGSETPVLDFVVGNTYIFDLSDSSNAGGSNGHPLRFSTTQDGTNDAAGTEFTTGVTATYGGEFGTDPGNNGANITITIQPYSPTLYYYCQSHSGMGGTSKIFLRTATQVGGDISGNDQADFKGPNEDDEDALFGYSVDLNETGDVLCVGAPQDSGTSTNGYAMVFKYDSVNDKWVNVSGKYTDGVNSYTTKNQSSLYDGSRNVVVSGGNLNFTLIESSMDVEDSDALMPFSRGRCPDYGSNIVVKSANRTDDNTDWNYSPETTITVGDFEQSDFEVDKLYFNRFVDVASTSPLTLRLSFKNKLGRVYATGPEPQDNDYNSGTGTPSPTLTMFNQFTFDISYNKGSINTPDWVDVSSNVNLNHWTTNGHVGSPVSTGDGLIYTILGADTNQAGTDWESIKPWKDGEGYGTITREDGDVALYFDNQAIKYTENNNITYWTHANSWRWNIRVSYDKGSSGNDKIVSQFNRFTNGEYDGDTSSFEIELAQFTQQSVEIPSPIPNSLSINTLNAPEIIIRNLNSIFPYTTGASIPYDTPIEIEVRFPRPVYADSHHGTNFFTYLGDSSQGGSIFDSEGQSDTWNGVVNDLDPVTDGAYGWKIQATVSNKWDISGNTNTINNSETSDFTPDEEIQVFANSINDKYGNPNIASSWIGWQVDFQNAFNNSQDALGDSVTLSSPNFADSGSGSGTYNITNIGQNWVGVGDTLNIKFYKNNNSSNPSSTDFKSNFTITGNTTDVTISSGSWGANNGYYELVLAVGGTASASSSDAIVSLNNSANGTYADTYQYTISFE